MTGFTYTSETKLSHNIISWLQKTQVLKKRGKTS